MLIHVSILTILSLLALVFAIELQHAVSHFYATHQYFTSVIQHIFDFTSNTSSFRQIIVLCFFPWLIALVPNTLYWLFKRKQMPYFYHVLWATWLILTTTIIATL